MHPMKLGILFGGCGEEHAVSVKSARTIAAHLNLAAYDPFYIGITQDGVWKHCAGPVPGWDREENPSVLLSPDRSTHGVWMEDGGRLQAVPLDVVFPVLHGRGGEDGSVQGLLELSGIPYVGCGVESSILCMNKALAYTVAARDGIATPNVQVVGQDSSYMPKRFPVFVKPARSGSSFGVSRVERGGALCAALQAAGVYDAQILIEEAVEGIEVGCAILGSGDTLFAGEVDQINLSHGFFRIHQEEQPEQGSENATFTVPADLAPPLRVKIQETAKKIYRALGCRGLARVDLFLTPEGRIVLNEVNTMPGFTAYSRYPRMMAAAGIPMSSLIDKLIQLALEE